jgi:hypothetical protein
MRKTNEHARRGAPVAELLEGRCLFNAVTSLQLINAVTDQPIKTLTNGDTINLAEFPAGQLSVRANTDSGVESVRFALDANANFRTENSAPYVLFGDNAGNISGGTIAVGPHTLTASPFSADNAGGTFSVGPHQVEATPFTGINATGSAGIGKSVTFTVVNEAPPAPEVTGLFLINADTDQVIQEIHDGDTFNRQLLSTLNLNVQAITTGATGSVRFGLDATSSFRLENFAPYALFGDNGGNDFVAGSIALGQHTLTATPFTGANATGTTGTAETVDFEIIDQPVVTGLFLINTDTQQVIQELHDGDQINQDDLGTQNLNVQALTSPSGSSVKFAFDQNDNFRVESTPPYALFGDAAGTFLAGSIGVGQHSIAATAFTGDNATGTEGDPLTVDFEIVADGQT